MGAATTMPVRNRLRNQRSTLGVLQGGIVQKLFKHLPFLIGEIKAMVLRDYGGEAYLAHHDQAI